MENNNRIAHKIKISTHLNPAPKCITKDMGYIDCDISLLTQSDCILIKEKSGKIKVRGNTTSKGDKRPYNIKFDKKINLMWNTEAKNWVLLADYYDATLMHNYMALDLAQGLGLPYTMEHQWVEVIIDSEYKGLYLLTSKIDDAIKKDLDEDKDFLVEMEVHGREEDGQVYFHTDQGYYFHLRYPKESSDYDTEDIKDRLSKFHNIMLSGKWKKVKKHIDVESFASYYILNEIMKTCDFERLSVYFFCKNDKLYAGPAWDYDLSCGYDYEQPMMIRHEWTPEGAWAANCHYFNALMKYPEFVEIVYDKVYNHCLPYLMYLYSAHGWIDAHYRRYKNDIDYNNKLIGSFYNSKSYLRELDYMKDWLDKRIRWFRQYLGSQTSLNRCAR